MNEELPDRLPTDARLGSNRHSRVDRSVRWLIRTLGRRTLAAGRNLWRRLTSMHTALMLLFLLSLAAVPGAILPQRNLNTQAVARYIADRPTLGPVMDGFQLFDVFASSWFTAIYVLLFVSLIGCLLPRLTSHLRSLLRPPSRTPANLSRLPHHWSGESRRNREEVLAVVEQQLRGWRVAIRHDNDSTTTVSAERGYLREAGNLVFHFSLVGLLITIAAGRLYGYEGSVIVIADGRAGFCNTSPAVYDSFRTGRSTDGTGLAPFCIKVNDFTADYLPNGQAQMFTADISYQAGQMLTTQRWNDYRLRVNEPLRISGARVYLTGHGYAPQFTVTFPDGQTRTEALQFRPEDAVTFLSSGALRFDPPGGTYATPEERRRNQIAIEGLFAPTAAFNDTLLTSAFPDLSDPAVAIDIYKGDFGLDSGIAQSIFALRRDLIEQGRLVKQARVNLRAGESTTLPDGSRVRFDGAKEFANLQVSYDPTQQWVLVSAVSMMTGLVVSLLIKRRRVWARLRVEGAIVRIDLGGLARSDQAGWGKEFERVRDRIRTATRNPGDTA